MDPCFSRGVSSWSGALCFCLVPHVSFPDRQEQRATGTSPYRVCLHLQLSASLLMASGGESGAAGVWVLEK